MRRLAIWVNIHMYITINEKNKAMNLKETREGYVGMFEGQKEKRK